MLVCGRRRLAAIKQLGWKTVNVWVRSGISERLGQLVAEQDDNVLHKPLTQLEAAALYRELRAVMAQGAARRQAASRFSAEHQPGNDGGGESPPPSYAIGKTREQAARMVTSTASYKRLEQVGWLQQIADDSTGPTALRAQVVAELERIEAGAAVNPIYQQVREAAARAAAERSAELDAMAQEALARVKATAKDKNTKKRPSRRAINTGEGVQVGASDGNVSHVEVFKMGSVRASIIGRPRPSSRQRRVALTPHSTVNSRHGGSPRPDPPSAPSPSTAACAASRSPAPGCGESPHSGPRARTRG